jgi:glycosyltransferase involved in cell wall biosynthesis
MPRAYSIVMSVPGVDTNYGGPSFTVPALITSVARQGVRGCLVTGAARKGGVLNLPPAELVPTRLVPVALGLGLRFPAVVAQAVSDLEARLIHVNGLWMPAGFLTGQMARQQRIPLVISPRGALGPWAWRRHAWKKRPVWWLWERRNLTYAAVLHATSQSEADGLRRLGLTNPIAVIPNGLDLSDRPDGTVASAPADGCRTILFFSRIHPSKGLANLVAAWRSVRRPGWRVMIAGTDLVGHLAEVQTCAQQAGVATDFVYPGAFFGKEKWNLYGQASLFVLPTFSENFGVVVAEALAAGIPVITTKGAPWKCLEDERCGWWVDLGVEPLATALRAAMNLSDTQRREMGNRGAALARTRFSWERIGLEMARVYDWVLGQGERPDCVQS